VKAWISILTWLLRIFIGPKTKSPRIRLEVKDEDVIAEERKHLEELKTEVRRIEHELDALSPKITSAIKDGDCRAILDLNAQRRRLRTDWDAARQRLLDFERYCGAGR